jgi:hypothetical protein
MKWLGRGLALALLPLITGCLPGIYSEQPLGERVAVLDPQEWNGVWLGNQGQLSGVLVTEPDKGMLVGDTADPCDPASGGGLPVQLRQSGRRSSLYPGLASSTSPRAPSSALTRRCYGFPSTKSV